MIQFFVVYVTKPFLYMRFFLLLIVFFAITPASSKVILRNGEDLKISLRNEKPEPVVQTAIDIFSKDFQAVFNSQVVFDEDGEILIGTIGMNSGLENLIDPKDLNELKNHPEAFLIKELKGKLVVLGVDKRGTAYGILELSRLIGVSPWEWWADASIVSKKQYVFASSYHRLDYPSVAHRGIFLNDEDFGLLPWSYLTNETNSAKGEIGPQTHERIFELLLRLRANTFWPAMHENTGAFYLTNGNKEMADKYGIYIGTSHCEPMMRNTNAEWKLAGEGIYDYVNNRDNVLKFWEERVKALSNSDNIYTLGIRGVHDSKMLGANTLVEQQVAINNIIQDQRQMIKDLVNPNVERVSQVFIPYKEVLDVYKLGLDIPDDVTLIWCDDNYGYIRHFPDDIEKNRVGGNGIYYHASYWGRPHDYLWLSTNHPALTYTQMKEAYNRGARDIWILNVGDIKPAEFNIELFLDLAWSIDKIENSRSGLDNYLLEWYSREFGNSISKDLVSIMNEYYRLAYIRKPEFMANTRTEEKDLVYKKVKDLPWSEREIRQRIKEYNDIEQKVIKLSSKISNAKKSSWFQLVEYPVLGSSFMNKKHLYAQLARHGKADWEQSDAAWQEIVSLTNHYDTLSDGKWNRMMNYKPRDLEVFRQVPRESASQPLKQDLVNQSTINGTSYRAFRGTKPKEYGLGYANGAIHLSKGSEVEYKVLLSKVDTVMNIDFALAPNHPIEGDMLRFGVTINGGTEQVISIRSEGRSEEWKENVLNNRTIRKLVVPVYSKNNIIKVRALDEGIVLDQLMVY